MSLSSQSNLSPVAGFADDPGHLAAAADAAARAGDWRAAARLYERSFRSNRRLESAAISACRCFMRVGDATSAIAILSELLADAPRHYTALMERGRVYAACGRQQDALTDFRNAGAAATYKFEPMLELGLLLEDMQHGEGPAVLRGAVAQAGRQGAAALSEVLRLIAIRRLARRDGAGALEASNMGLHHATTNRQDENEICRWLIRQAEALLMLGRTEEAWSAFSASSAATAEDVLARLGDVSYQHGMMEEAEEVFRRAWLLHPDSANAAFNLGKILSTRWKVAEAQAILDRAEHLYRVAGNQPMLAEIGITKAAMHWRSGNADAAFNAYSALNTGLVGHAEVPASIAMTSLYSDRLSAAEIRDTHRMLFATMGSGARQAGSFVRPPLDGRRLRVGMLGADMKRFHPVNMFMQPVLRELDRSRIEVFFYHCSTGYDDQTHLARQRVEHWHEVAEWSDERLAVQMDRDGLDLLIDLVGHTSTNRAPVLARRAAPVQAMYLGYPGTTGLPNVDWILGDSIVTPLELDHLYTERVFRLPGTVFCFAPETDFPPLALGERTGPIVFGSINNAPKLNARTLRCYAGVLAAVPQSRLSLRAPSFVDDAAIEHFRAGLRAAGADLGRVDFHPPLPLPEMMAAFDDIDIVLDSVPYCGGTTTHQALWMGVPVVTMMGEGFAARMGASFLSAAGLTDLVATDDAGYLAVAEDLANDRARLADLRRNLRSRLIGHEAWNVVRHTRAIEDAMFAMARGGARRDADVQ